MQSTKELKVASSLNILEDISLVSPYFYGSFSNQSQIYIPKICKDNNLIDSKNINQSESIYKGEDTLRTVTDLYLSKNINKKPIDHEIQHIESYDNNKKSECESKAEHFTKKTLLSNVERIDMQDIVIANQKKQGIKKTSYHVPVHVSEYESKAELFSNNKETSLSNVTHTTKETSLSNVTHTTKETSFSKAPLFTKETSFPDPDPDYESKAELFSNNKETLFPDYESNSNISIRKKSGSIDIISIDTNYRRNNRAGSYGSGNESMHNSSHQNNNKVPKIYPYVGDGMNIDNRTQLNPNGKGASSIIWSLRRVQGEDGRFTGKRSLCILLGLEKYGKYSGKYNLFGGHFEDIKDNNLKDTVVRELSEEFSPRIIDWVQWFGSPWAFNQSYIEIGSVSSNFSISKSFRENDEIKDARWFPVDNILKSRYINEDKLYYTSDLRGKEEFEITIYAQGVLKALDNNGQIR